MSLKATDILKARDYSADDVKVDLAAACRLAVYHDLNEGIDNHFTATVPGYSDRFFVLPFGLHWSEASTSNLIVFNEAGETLEGEGEVELTAQCIHAPIHRITGKQVVMHTHQPWALALNMLENNRLVPATQTAALFDKLIAYDDDYQGLVNTIEEGERLAAIMGDRPIAFLKNHGVMVASKSVAGGYQLLYLLERACRTQVLAMSTGQRLAIIPDEIISKTSDMGADDRHAGRRHFLFLQAMKRVLDREMPGYAD